MTLSERFEAAEPGEAAGLLEVLALQMNSQCDWCIFNHLRNINNPESLFAAAMMLMPEGSCFNFNSHWQSVQVYRPSDPFHLNSQKHGMAKSPALALGAAIARSLGL